jgi:hypothetical protein
MSKDRVVLKPWTQSKPGVRAKATRALNQSGLDAALNLCE